MAVAAIAGAYASAGIARKLGQKTVRRIVVGIGLSIAVLMFLRPVQ